MVEVISAADSNEIDVDNVVDETTGIRYIGTARRGFDGRWTCLAQVGCSLCIVEVRVRPTVHFDEDPGDVDDRGDQDARFGRDLAQRWR